MFTFWVIFPSMKNITTHSLSLWNKAFVNLSSQARVLFKLGWFKGFKILAFQYKTPDVWKIISKPLNVW